MPVFSLFRFFALTDAARSTKNFVLWVFMTAWVYYPCWEFTLVRYIWGTRAKARVRPMVYTLLSVWVNPALWLILVLLYLLGASTFGQQEELAYELLFGYLGTTLQIFVPLSFVVSAVLVNLLAGDVKKALEEQEITLSYNRIWLCLFQGFYVRYKLHALYTALPEEAQSVTVDFDQNELYALLGSRSSTWYFVLYNVLTVGSYGLLWSYTYVKYAATSAGSQHARPRAYLSSLVTASVVMERLGGLVEGVQWLHTHAVQSVTLLVPIFFQLWFLAGGCRDTQDALQREGVEIKFRLFWLFPFFYAYPYFKLHEAYMRQQKEDPCGDLTRSSAH